MENTALKGRSNHEIACIVARIHGVTPRYVRMVVNGERNNDDIMHSYIEYQKGKRKLIEELAMCVPKSMEIRKIKTKI